MIFSLLAVNHASDQYIKSRKTENYEGSCNGGGSSLALLIIASVFLVIEIALLYFAIKIALASGKSPATTFVNVVLALTMTLPYLLLSVLFNPDARAALGDGAPALKFACNY
jgi:heme/copper-type cytochrome/quinol oxidase subunit 2